MRRFWDWLTPEPDNTADPDGNPARVLRIQGTIAEESWFDDDVTPQVFASELNAGTGPVTVWLNSPGGDVVAAARIYNLLLDYPGAVRVNIDGIAASAASVIAMAGSTVAMSPVSMLMIHNPATLAVGDKDELAKAMSMLASVKDSIINAYQLKTGLSRAKLSKLMDAETWMDATAAIDLGFADTLLTGKRDPLLDAEPDEKKRKPDPDKDEDQESEGDPDEEEPDEELDDPDEDPDRDDPDEDSDGDPDEDSDEDGGKKKKAPPFPPKKNRRTGGVVFSRRTCEQRLVAHLKAGLPPKHSAPPGFTPELVRMQPAGSRGRRVVDLYAELANQPH